MDESNRNTLTGLAAPDGRIKLHVSVRHSARSARIGFCLWRNLPRRSVPNSVRQLTLSLDGTRGDMAEPI